MGLFENLFKKQKIEHGVNGYFKSLTAYSPCFTTFEGGVYEMELTRAAIGTIAAHCSKFKPEIKGPGNQALERKLQFRPNPYMDTSKFYTDWQPSTRLRIMRLFYLCTPRIWRRLQGTSLPYPSVASFLRCMESRGYGTLSQEDNAARLS